MIMRLYLILAVFSLFFSAVLRSEELRAPEHPNIDLVLIAPRLQAHIGAFEDWLNLTCGLTHEQQAAVSKACGDALTRTTNRFAELPVIDSEFDGSEFLSTPILFCGVDGAAPSLFDSKLRRELDQILTQEQRERFQAEGKIRQQRCHEASVGRIIKTIDDKLYLKQSQRTEVQANLLAAQPPFSNALFSFQFNAHDFGCKFLSKQDFLPRSLMTAPQLAHLETLSESFPDYGFHISGRYSDEQYLSFLKRRATQDQESLKQYVKMQVDSLSEGADDETLRFLQLACEGAVERVINDWYRSHLRRLFDERGHREDQEHFWGQRVNTFLLDEDPFLRVNLTNHKLLQAMLDKSPAQDDVLKAYTFMLFDQELWLTSEQRKEFEPYLLDRIDYIGTSVRPRGTFQVVHDDIREFGRVLYSVPDEKMVQLLSGRQLAVWKLLKEHLTCNDNLIEYRQRREFVGLGYLWKPPSTEN